MDDAPSRLLEKTLPSAVAAKNADATKELETTKPPFKGEDSDSDSEIGATKEDVAPDCPLRPLSRPRNKSRRDNRSVPKTASVSDDSKPSYGANVTSHQRRSLNSQIPKLLPLDLNFDPRRISPDERTPTTRGHAYDNPELSPLVSGKNGVRSTSYLKGPNTGRSPIPRSPAAGGHSAFRRQPTQGSGVSNLATHSERISQEYEHAARGRKPWAIASAQAEVEILGSAGGAVKDEDSESLFESSKADGVGGPTRVPTTSPPDTAKPATDYALHSASTSPTAFTSPPPPSGYPHTSHFPTDTETGIGEGDSPLEAPTDLRPGQVVQSEFGWGKYPIVDPEHIFRDHSMVVRTDEPTSIIALTLKYAFFYSALDSC